MAETDSPYDDPYYGYYDPYYGFIGEPHYSYRNGFRGPYNYLPPVERFPSWPPGQQGPYTGCGPPGYQRADTRIRSDVSNRLWEDSQVDAGDVTLGVDNGVVTLDGSVDSRWAKRIAEDIAWSVPGVRDVINSLTVTPHTP